MANLTLYHVAPSRSSVVLWMLEELGEPYDLHVMGFKTGETRSADYLRINPMGKVPALKHGDTIITEGAAIGTYLRRPARMSHSQARALMVESRSCLVLSTHAWWRQRG